MKKGIRRLVTLVLAVIALSACMTVSAAERDDFLDCDYVKITGDGFVADSLNGVDAIYNLYGPKKYCTEFVERYYRTIYGVTVLHNYNGPYVYSDSECYFQTLADTDTPQSGDVIYWPVNTRNKNYAHTALVKSYEEGVITIIEQNWSYAGRCAFERTVSWPSENYTVSHFVDPNAPVYTAAVDDIVVIDGSMADIRVESSPCTASAFIELASGAVSGKVSLSMVSRSMLSLVMGLTASQEELTREEAFVCIARLVEAAGVDAGEYDADKTLAVYKDADDIDADARASAAVLTELGVVKAGLDMKCAPQDTLTVEQCQVLMMRVAALLG